MIDLNATQAAIRAGYSHKTANEQGSRLLANVSVQEALSAMKEKVAKSSEITREMLVGELRKIAFFDIRKIYTVDGGLKNIHDFEDDEAHAVASIESYDEREPDSGMILGTTQKVKIHNKIQAIERISKMLGFDAPSKVDLSLENVQIFKLPDNGRDDKGSGTAEGLPT